MNFKRLLFWVILGAVLVGSSLGGLIVLPPIPAHLQPLVHGLATIALVWSVATLAFGAGVEAGVKRVENRIMANLKSEVIDKVAPRVGAGAVVEGAGEDKPHRRYYGG